MVRRSPILIALLLATASSSVWLLSGRLPSKAQGFHEGGQPETPLSGPAAERPDAGEKASRYSLVQPVSENGKPNGFYVLDTRTGKLWGPDPRPDSRSWEVVAEPPRGGKEGSYQFLGVPGESYLLDARSGQLWELGPKKWVRRCNAPK